MAETLYKLRPDRDLQCYFERPTAIAAMHHASEFGFRLSGSWRQQFDWVVVEWNRDNVIEHPVLRNLPDSDFRGLNLSYDDTRTNCIPLDSTLYPTVDWPYLRIWAEDGNGVEQFYQVSLADYATPIVGAYLPAMAEMGFSGTLVAGGYAGISFLGENHTYQLTATDTPETTVQAIVDSVNTFSSQVVAERAGTLIRLRYVGAGQSLANSTTGHNGNRIGVYGFVSGSGTGQWSPWWAKFSGGVSPASWRVVLPFDSLVDRQGVAVPVHAVRKMRWTYAADMQDGSYAKSEFEVDVSNWSVTGANRAYRVAGTRSRRIEDDAAEVSYTGTWTESSGNFSGGTIHFSEEPGASVSCTYAASGDHELQLGTRSTFSGTRVTIKVDGLLVREQSLLLPGEDVLQRFSLGGYGPGSHSVTVTHSGNPGEQFYFDFLELADPVTTLPVPVANTKTTLATDWDTDHSLAVPAERTAWLIQALGFHGRVNHYAGALWFYELRNPVQQYASATVDFVGTPVFSQITELRIGRTDEPSSQDVVLSHVNRIGDTAETIAKAFELELNRGYTAVRAETSGTRLTIYSRAMGSAGNAITVVASPSSGGFQVLVSGATLSGGLDGKWITDLSASPRLNRAARDWSASFFTALAGYGLEATAAFSMELQHGDDSTQTGIAQRYPDGSPVWLNTPALQTNFSPASTDFWKEVYREMASLMAQAGLQPYLQFGEAQWWYFPKQGAGMPFDDNYTQTLFRTTYGQDMQVIPSNDADPALYPQEMEFLPSLIGAFTDAVMSHVRVSYPNCRFEVLYPTDVNETAFNSLINYPAGSWSSSVLDGIKTESFTYTSGRDLDAARQTVVYGKGRGFTALQRGFLVGIGDPKSSWLKEVRAAMAENLESVVLFALDQFCLIGYPAPLPASRRSSRYLG